MDGQTLETLIERRDETVTDLGGYLPNTISSLLDGHAVTLFEGITVTKVDEQTPVEDDWGYRDVSNRLLYVSVKGEKGIEQFFRIAVYYDSWDNGERDEWQIRQTPQEMQKVPVEKFEWKEVW